MNWRGRQREKTNVRFRDSFERIMKVAVIGAGIGGLLATKYAQEHGISVDCFEKSSRIGGVWVYSDSTGLDKHGQQIHSGMYRSLRTNLPKETMGFHDFPFSQPQRSFVTHFEVLDFIETYGSHFGLLSLVKFEHLVQVVSPIENGKWNVSVKNLASGDEKAGVYDAVFVCNGCYSVPNYPKIKGIEHFGGRTLHSHDYRVPSPFEKRRVLVIGAGPSGIDITFDVATKAEFVAMSHHRSPIQNYYPENVSQKPDVAEVLEDGRVSFCDGTTGSFDVIIFCTGYNYSYPFLSPQCDIKVDDNHVTTLYKHLVNIHHPTMFLIGVPFISLISYNFELQVRLCFKYLTGQKALPSRDEMLADYERDLQERQSQGLKKRKMHFLGLQRCRQYYEDLTRLAGVDPIKPVILDIFDRSVANHVKVYREYNYKILDDFKFSEYL